MLDIILDADDKAQISEGGDYEQIASANIRGRECMVWLSRARDKMTNILQTTDSNAFSWKKLYEFRFRFH